MAWHKHKAYDPTDAFIQNDRQQKLLELKLDGIDKLWFTQLKHIARERLEIAADLTKIESEKNRLKYFDNNMDIQDIREHSDEMAKKLKKDKTEVRRDNYNFDSMKDRTVTVPLKMQLPRLANQMSKCSVKSNKKKKAGTKLRRKSKLKATRIYSISDSNLHKSFKADSDMKSETTKEDETKSNKSKPVSVENFSSATDKFLPLLQMSGEQKSDDHRYLRQKMATSLALPPLTEVTHRRKYSV